MTKAHEYLNHDHINPDEYEYQESALPRAKEAHELAMDIKHLGSVAFLSEVQAAHAAGTTAEIDVPNPVAKHLARKARHGDDVSYLESADASLRGMQTALDSYDESQEFAAELGSIAPGSLGLQLLRGNHEHRNLEMILETGALPELFRNAKDMSAKAAGKNPDEFLWNDWFNAADDEQLTNFTQWYAARLKLLSDPGAKAEYVEVLKADYQSRVQRGMQEGWIDASLKSTFDERITAAKVRFFSPFGQMPDIAGAFSQHLPGKPSLVALPAIDGKQNTVHEFGHVAARLSGTDMEKYIADKHGKAYLQDNKLAVEHMHTILNEGYNDHITAALIDGEPTIVRPSARQYVVAETPGACEDYVDYREILGDLLAGREDRILPNDIKRMVTNMVDGSFSAFAQQVSEKWDGRDVMSEMLEIIAEHDKVSRLPGDPPDSYGYDDNELVKKISTALYSDTAAAA